MDALGIAADVDTAVNCPPQQYDVLLLLLLFVCNVVIYLSIFFELSTEMNHNNGFYDDWISRIFLKKKKR